MKTAKIVCTLGPASSDWETIFALAQEGMDMARFNMSHGSIEEHRQRATHVRRLQHELGRPVSLMVDLQGPRVRVGKLEDDGILLERGQKVCLVPESSSQIQDHQTIPTTYPPLSRDVGVGDPILIDDGRIRLLVESIEGQAVRAKVDVGGKITANKGINLPASHLSVPAFTDKDRKDLNFALEIDADYVALSFVRTPQDVQDLKEAMQGHPEPPLIIAKIEKPQAVESLDSILDVTDGIMVARGDLGVEMPMQEVPGIQLDAIRKANARGKEVIIATQMLESMITQSLPTRAEVTDVAVAVMEGTDAVMLSGETAIGAHPALVVRTMQDIVTAAGRNKGVVTLPNPSFIEGLDLEASAVGRAAVEISKNIPVALIALFTRKGHTARLVSDYRPEVPILALTDSERTYRRMALLWGVIPSLLAIPSTTEEMLTIVETRALSLGLARRGDRILVTLGHPPGPHSGTNMLTIRRL